MMCQRIGRPPTSTIGFGRNSVSSRRRVPRPPHKITTFTEKELLHEATNLSLFHMPRAAAKFARALASLNWIALPHVLEGFGQGLLFHGAIGVAGVFGKHELVVIAL